MTEDFVDKILKERYMIDGETCWSNICARVATYIGNTEEERDEFFRLLADKDFLPNSPTLMNAGTDNPMLSACFYIPVEDSIDSIFDANKNAAKIFKSGGGVGFNFSKLRPKGSKVGNRCGVSSGVVSFMEVFNTMTEVVKQGGLRRGAMMACLNVTHPEIKDFIVCKHQEGKLSNFNISVKLTDEFMNNLEDPHNREIMDLIVDGIWRNGEPGILFKDTIEKYNPAPENGELSPNPCLYKDTYLFTSCGLEKIENLHSSLYDGNIFVTPKVWGSGIKETVKIITKSGYEYITTPDHLFMLDNNSWCEAHNLIGKHIKHDISEKFWIGVNPNTKIDYEVAGFLFGDGSYHGASRYVKYVYFTPDKDCEVINKFKEQINSDIYKTNDNKLMMSIPKDSVYSTLFTTKIEYRNIPDWIMALPKPEMKLFLRGLFSANGCNLSEYSKIQLVSINKPMLQQVQQMLAIIGIKAKLWVHNKSQDVNFTNGKYTCKTSYHLVISRISYSKYMKEIGFIQSYKNRFDSSKHYTQEFDYEEVISVESNGLLSVYDFNSPNTHYGLTNGAYVHNCGEALLSDYEACCLGSINLSNHIVDGVIDWAKLSKTVELGVIFLNNVIDKNKFPLPEIDRAVKRTRKIGLGVMGWHDALIKMGVPYSSDKALDIANDVMCFINTGANNASAALGDNPLIGVPRKNASCTSIAPTGTISLIAGVSSGIEPVFNWVYTRHDTFGDHLIVHPLFEAALKKAVKGYTLNAKKDFEEVIKHCNEKGTIQDIAWLPQDFKDLFMNASDIKPISHVLMQAEFQKYVDQSISKTINCNAKTTKKEIEQIIIDAWNMDCKGLTIYRNGSRENEVLSNKIATEPFKAPLKRPKFIDCKPQGKYKSGCGNLYLTLGTVDGKPYTISIEGKHGGCTSLLKAIEEHIRLEMRNGIPIADIVKACRETTCNNALYQFKQGKCDGKSCSAIVGDYIEHIMKDSIITDNTGNLSQNTDKCPDCGKPVVMESGCKTCKNCGWSRCN